MGLADMLVRAVAVLGCSVLAALYLATGKLVADLLIDRLGVGDAVP